MQLGRQWRFWGDRSVTLELAVLFVDPLVELERLAVEFDAEARSSRNGNRSIHELDLLLEQIVHEECEELLVPELGQRKRGEHVRGGDRRDAEVRERVLADWDAGRLARCSRVVERHQSPELVRVGD